VSTTPEGTGARWDREHDDGGHPDGYHGRDLADDYDGDPDDRDPVKPPLPRGVRILRAVAVAAVVITALIGIAGVWRAQTGGVSEDKLAERRAHERAYSQLAGDPTGPGAARVQTITVTDARVFRTGGSAAGTLAFTVYNSGELTRIRSVHVTVGGAPVSRVLYVAQPGADPVPLPADGVVLDRHAQTVFAPDGTSFALIGLPAGTKGQRADVTLTVDSVGRVEFQTPVQGAGTGRP
jgi:hypothetical protein